MLAPAHLPLLPAIALAFAATALSTNARASAPKDEAHAAYERGLAAHARGDEAAASDEFAHADEWLPSDAALEAAIESAERANDPVRVTRLVLRGEGRTLDTQAARTLREARRTFLPQVALLEVECTAVSECTLAVDDATSVDAHAPVPVLPGKYRLHVKRGETIEEASAEVRAGQVVTFAHSWAASPPSSAAAQPGISASAADAPRDRAPSSEPSPPARRPGWVQPVAWLGIGATALLTGFAIGSGIDTSSKHSDFTSHNCGAGSATPGAIDPACAGLSQDGHAAQSRTDWLIAGAALAGVATMTFVLLERPFGQVDIAAGPRDARLTLRIP